MKKLFCLSILICSLAFVATAQPDGAKTQRHGGSYAFNLGVDVPIKFFKEMSSTGFAFDYAWSDQRFGKLDAKPSILGFTFNMGIAHYLGADDHHGGNLAGYTNVHTYGGVIISPCKTGNISLTGGPNLGLYSGNSKFGFGARADVSWYLTNHIAITPGFLWIKELDVDPRYAITGRLTIAF